MTTIIETDALTKRYPAVTALNNLSLQIPRNSIFGFLGPNGAGKSTTMKLLLGLIWPTSGRATVFGHDIMTDSVAIRQRIGYLAQDPRFYDYMTARETLRFVANFFEIEPSKVEKRIDESLELVGLINKADRSIKGFSGGERQRLGIAQAQLNEPDLLILDEPAAALDPMGRRDVLHIIEQLREQTTIFYSTHILDDVERVSDMVAIVNRGELVAQAPITELLRGNGRSAYTIDFVGQPNGAKGMLEAQAWVTDVITSTDNEVQRWEVSVSDEAAAESQILPILLNGEGISVKSFGKSHHNLEDVFVSLIENR